MNSEAKKWKRLVNKCETSGLRVEDQEWYPAFSKWACSPQGQEVMLCEVMSIIVRNKAMNEWCDLTDKQLDLLEDSIRSLENTVLKLERKLRECKR